MVPHLCKPLPEAIQFAFIHLPKKSQIKAYRHLPPECRDMILKGFNPIEEVKSLEEYEIEEIDASFDSFEPILAAINEERGQELWWKRVFALIEKILCYLHLKQKIDTEEFEGLLNGLPQDGRFFDNTIQRIKEQEGSLRLDIETNEREHALLDSGSDNPEINERIKQLVSARNGYHLTQRKLNSIIGFLERIKEQLLSFEPEAKLPPIQEVVLVQGGDDEDPFE